MNNRLPIMKNLLTSSVVLAIGFMILGCEQNNMNELKAYVDKVKARQPKALKPIPTIKPYLRYIYPIQDIDPFDRSALAPRIPITIEDKTGQIKKVLNKGIQIDKSRVPEYLEGFTIESLLFVGSVTQSKQLWALVKVPDGSIQRVKKGNYIGTNHGKIIKVTDQSILIRELVPNGFGAYKERENQVRQRLD